MMKSVLPLVCLLSIFSNTPLDAAAKLGEITKTCETNLRAKYYNQTMEEINKRREKGTFGIWYNNTYLKAFHGPNFVKDSYREYNKTATEKRNTPKLGLSGLRDIGQYSPDPTKNQEKNISKSDMAKKGTLLQELKMDATPEQFAAQLSLAHPSNPRLFEDIMKCVHEGRGANQTEVIVESVPATAPPPLHTFTQSDLDAALGDLPQPNTDNLDLDLDDDLLLDESSDMDINLGGTLVPVH